MRFELPVRAFWLLVLPPLVIAGYLAVRVTREDAALRRHELQALLDGRLADVRSRASHALARIEREVGEPLAAAPTTPADLRALGRKMPLASQVFRLDKQGRLVFPVAGPDASREEREFLDRTTAIWTGRAILAGRATAVEQPHRRTTPGIGDSLVDLTEDHGWLAWYWAEGLHLLYWRRAPDGGVIGAELERVGVLARIVGALPTTATDDSRMELADSRGETVHQWGALAAGTARPDATLALDPPLDSWQLRYFISPAQREGLLGGTDVATLLGLAAVALAVLALAIYLYREYTRRLREASERVGFVTRVSHELRTPLANIRMYAELIEDAATDTDAEQLRRARVIVSESQRLGQLIDNVLAFSRRRAAAAPVVAVDVDAAVRETVAKFEPAFATRAIELRLDLAAPVPARAGAGAVEQIVTNLMSNVEKYAPGGAVTVTTRAADGHVIVDVADQGPGVPAHERARIFEPFHRANSALTESTRGTGIGLAIARELARAAGGDLVLADAERGARFELTLPAAGEAS